MRITTGLANIQYGTKLFDDKVELKEKLLCASDDDEQLLIVEKELEKYRVITDIDTLGAVIVKILA